MNPGPSRNPRHGGEVSPVTAVQNAAQPKTQACRGPSPSAVCGSARKRRPAAPLT